MLKFAVFLLFIFTGTARVAAAAATRHFPGFAAFPRQERPSILLPAGRPFPTLPSDPRDLRMALRGVDGGGLEADIGGYRSFIGWKKNFFGRPFITHFGMEGGAKFSLRAEDDAFPLESTDGDIGFYLETSDGRRFYQLRLNHISAHLADGAPDESESIQFSRESASFRVARQIRWLKVYGGLEYLIHTIPENVAKTALQLGFYAIFPRHLGKIHPYAGVDLRAKRSPEGTTRNFSAGLAIVSENGEPPVRLAFNYLTGHDIRGQFFDRDIEKFTVGIEIDF